MVSQAVIKLPCLGLRIHTGVLLDAIYINGALYTTIGILPRVVCLLPGFYCAFNVISVMSLLNLEALFEVAQTSNNIAPNG